MNTVDYREVWLHHLDLAQQMIDGKITLPEELCAPFLYNLYVLLHMIQNNLQLFCLKTANLNELKVLSFMNILKQLTSVMKSKNLIQKNEAYANLGRMVKALSSGEEKATPDKLCLAFLDDTPDSWSKTIETTTTTSPAVEAGDITI